MSAITKRDVIDAAMSVAEDVAESRLDPTQLNQAVADECKASFGSVVGEDDPLWPLHIDVARQVLAVGGLSADELSEWLAVARLRAGVPLSTIDPPAGTSGASGTLSPEMELYEGDLSSAPEPEPYLDPEPETETETEQAAPASTSAMVELPDGRRIHRRHIIARGRELPTGNGLREF
ncbi:hypothetical protein BST11_21050 [Mycobacterium alsense]|uniref:Flagellar hook-length control protein n=1 Tax=Mycobacterium alsense TaxID=324058 RepID=A0AA41XLU3_9MYCO|nr:hypothetical protein [Mycobacterium alsense]MCV7377947.1 flagellar hook-length control protein [Mycobacterium alsense]OQZ88813.1 hypothetical protein BST11_21050 [Mycobacterium alsense]